MPRTKCWAVSQTNSIAVAKKALRLAALLLLCVTFFTWSLPAQAASRINRQLEEQVLQIIRQHPEAILESVQGYQEQMQRQIQQAQQAFVQQLKTDPKAIIGESPTTGSPESKIVLVEFSDFQCPYCAEAHKTLKQFMEKHQDEVTLVYKHFPLTPIHPEAMPAAKAAWAASQQGKFWEYHDALFSQQEKLGEQLYLDIARSLNLDLEKFQRDRNIAETAIQEDILLAESLGISGTPYFAMNGQLLSGAVQLSDMENLLARIEGT